MRPHRKRPARPSGARVLMRAGWSRALFKGLPLPSYVWKKAGDDFVLADYNDAAEVITRGKVAGLVGETASSMYPDVPEVPADLARCFIERTTVFREMPYRFRSTGETRRLAVTYGFAPPDCVLVHTEDVTERRLVEEQLRQADEECRALFENAIFGMGQATPEGRFLKANAALAHLYGYETPEELIASVTDIAQQHWVEPERRDEFKRLLDRYGQVSGYEIALRRRDGSTAWVTANIRAVRDQAGVVRCYEGMLEDITARKWAERKIETQREQLRALSRRLLEAQEAERRRIAQGLHDDLGQLLTAVRLNVQKLDRLVGGVAGPPIRDSLALIDQGIRHVRDLSFELRPSVLDDLGLVPALEWYVNRQAGRAGFAVRLETETVESRLPAAVEVAAFRITQEALTNVARHARASNVSIMLIRHDASVELVVRDDGNGFDADAAQSDATADSSLGILGMRETASLVNGALAIVSAPGEGTMVRAWFSLSPAEVAAGTLGPVA